MERNHIVTLNAVEFALLQHMIKGALHKFNEQATFTAAWGEARKHTDDVQAERIASEALKHFEQIASSAVDNAA